MIRESLGTFRLGVKSLALHKLRSFLTTLGILIGVAAVVAMLAFGEGSSHEAQEQIKAMGSTNILIQSIKPPEEESDAGASMWSANAYGLTYRDANLIRGTWQDQLEEVVPVRQTDKEIRVTEKWLPTVLLGTTPEYLQVMGMQVKEGRWLNELDDRKRDNVAVLGGDVAKTLFPTTNPLGEFIKASGDRFVVIGVLEMLGRRSGSIGRSVDNCIYVPISTSKRRFGEINRKSSGGSFEMEIVELHEIKVKVKEQDQVEPVARVITDILERGHKNKDYSMVVPLELLRQAEETKRQFQLLLFCIASISLIVGGIGIMNVMLATVTERTREIGIRRALGAQKKHIVSQFLVETVVLSGFGGILGLVAGILIPYLATLVWTDLHAIVRPEHPLLAFGISALVGICAGLYPAWRAANMDPVEALRHE